MAKTTLCIALLAGFLILGSSRVTAQKDTVIVGAFVNSIHDFDFSDRSYKIDFWLWLLYENPELEFENSIELKPTKEASLDNPIYDETGGLQWLSLKALATMSIDWDLRRYPFDSQQLHFYIESADADTSTMVFVPDVENTKIDPNFVLSEWNITNVSFTSEVSTYATTYGDQELTGESSYPAVKMTIDLTRKNSWLTLFKLITGVLVAFFISSLVFLIKPSNVDPRFGLCVGGLFAAIGNKYIIEGIVPSTNSVTMLDSVHNLTYVMILVIIIISIISLKLFEKETEKSVRLSQKIDKYSLLIIVTVYVISVSLLIYKGVTGA